MFNIETIEQLAKIKEEELLSIYLDIDRKKYSTVVISDKVKDLFKTVDLEESLKREIEKKVRDFISRCSKDTKSVAVFVSPKHWFSYVFPFEVEDSIFLDSFFNLEPLILLLSKNRNIGVFLLDSEQARFFAIFLGEIEDHHHFEDQIVKRHHEGGWSQKRFTRHTQEIIKRHLKNSLDFLLKMHRIYKFEYLYLRSEPELEHEFVNMLPAEIKKKLKGGIKVSMNAKPQEVIEKALELEEKEVEKEEVDLVAELSNLIHSKKGEGKVVSGLLPVLDALYNQKISLLLVNSEFSQRGTYCKFCHYISLSDEYCPYDETPNNKVKDIVTLIIDEALSQKAEVEVFEDDQTLKDLGNIAAFLKE